MTGAVPFSSSRGLYRVAAVNSTAVPASVAGGDTDPEPSGPGIVKHIDAIYARSSGAGGVERNVKLVPCSTSSATYDLVVFGAILLVDQWVWVPLFKGSVAATLAHTGVNSANSIGTSEYLPATITEASGGPGAESGANVVTNYGSAVGPAHVVINTRGCPYLLLQASAANKFVLVGGYS